MRMLLLIFGVGDFLIHQMAFRVQILMLLTMYMDKTSFKVYIALVERSKLANTHAGVFSHQGHQSAWIINILFDLSVDKFKLFF